MHYEIFGPEYHIELWTIHFNNLFSIHLAFIIVFYSLAPSRGKAQFNERAEASIK